MTTAIAPAQISQEEYEGRVAVRTGRTRAANPYKPRCSERWSRHLFLGHAHCLRCGQGRRDPVLDKQRRDWDGGWRYERDAILLERGIA